MGLRETMLLLNLKSTPVFLISSAANTRTSLSKPRRRISPGKLCDLGAQAIEDAGKLGRDITTTHN